jgi:hypothetical protein
MQLFLEIILLSPLQIAVGVGSCPSSEGHRDVEHRRIALGNIFPGQSAAELVQDDVKYGPSGINRGAPLLSNKEWLHYLPLLRSNCALAIRMHRYLIAANASKGCAFTCPDVCELGQLLSLRSSRMVQACRLNRI